MQFKSKATPRFLYHMSQPENTKSILRDGLIPDMAKGKIKRVWACELNHFARIAHHLADRQDSHYCEFTVFVITTTWLYQFSRHANPGVWTTKELIAPTHCEHAYIIAVDGDEIRTVAQPLSCLKRSLVNTTLSGR